MSFTKITKPSLPLEVDLEQELRDVLSEALKFDETPAAPEEPSITPEAFEDLVQALVDTQKLGASDYNSIADEVVYMNNGQVMDADQMRALRNENRNRALAYQDQIQVYKEIYQRNISSGDQSGVSYKASDHEDLDKLIGDGWDTSGEITPLIYSGLITIRDALVAAGAATVNSVEFETTPGSLDLSGFGGTDDFEVISGADLDVVVEGIDLFEDRMADVPAAGVPFPTAYALGYQSVTDAENLNQTVISTLSGIDDQTSYVESLFGIDTDNIDIDMAGRPARFTLSEIWENCFDCFAGVWNGDVDFKFSIDIELRLKALLDVIQDLLDAIAYSIDLPGIILSNTCSLMRIGALCPIEIAFLISSLVALVRFTLSEVILNFEGFVGQLIAAVLKPMLNALELSSNLAVAPFHGYVGCVQRTILSTQQSNWTGSFTRDQMHEILNGRSLVGVPEEAIHGFLDKVKDFDPDLLSLILLQPTHIGSDNLLQWLGDPNLAQYTDPVEYFSLALIESDQRLTQAHQWIKNTLAGLKNFAATNSVARVELVAKIIALSTLIGVLIAIGNRIVGKEVVCTEGPIDKATGKTSVTPALPPDQLIQDLDLPGIWKLESDGVIINGASSPGTLVNRVTGDRLPLLSCGKVSDTDLKSILETAGVA